MYLASICVCIHHLIPPSCSHYLEEYFVHLQNALSLAITQWKLESVGVHPDNISFPDVRMRVRGSEARVFKFLKAPTDASTHLILQLHYLFWHCIQNKQLHFTS